MVSHEWWNSWPNSALYALNRDISDHCPLMIRCQNVDWGPKPFKSRNCWLLEPSFVELVKFGWNSASPQGWGAFAFKEKLKALKQHIKQWDKENVGNLERKSKEIVKCLNDLDIKEEDEDLSLEEQRLKSTLLEDFWKVAKLNDSILFQKSRDRWIKEGDSNTKYFHNVINWRRRVNELRGLLIQGNWVDEPTIVKREVKSFFEDRFRVRTDFGLSLDGVPFNSISRAERDSLTACFDLEEIKAAVWDCDGDRSPGQDGFNFRFIKFFWHEMKNDIKRVVDDFHRNASWPKGVTLLLLLSFRKWKIM